jgi:hypothetical protein
MGTQMTVTIEQVATRPQRPDIAMSWRRAQLTGLDPESGGQPRSADVERRSRLRDSAQPVLDDLSARLAGHDVCMIMADREGTVVQVSSGQAGLRRHLAGYGVDTGAVLDEVCVGTNALGTALELGRPVAVHGSEHYLAALKSFSCVGEPIRHPLTGRIEGVLDLTEPGAMANPLFGPLLAGAAREIESRIVEGARAADRRLFLAFQNATRLRSTPVAVLGRDLLLTNKACVNVMGAVDPAILRSLIPRARAGGRTTQVLDLGPRGRLQVLIELVEDTDSGALFYLGDLEPADVPQTLAPDLSAVLIAGEPGSGRTSMARDHAMFRVESLHATAALTLSEAEWVARFESLASRPNTSVLVDEVQLLPARLIELIGAALTRPDRAQILLVSGPLEEAPVHVTRLSCRCDAVIESAPLRERPHEFATLLHAIIERVRPDGGLTFGPQALAELSTYAWPGNLAELERLVRAFTHRVAPGPVDVSELPPRFRSPMSPSLGGRERAERAATVSALARTNGNKSRAAELLGVSRTTLYRRMQALGVVG